MDQNYYNPDAKIKVSELFYSIQGEGRYMGVPSIFLRTFGCNFKCRGFGMPIGELSKEADLVAENADIYADYKDLPLVSTGCDSYASWHPAFKHLSKVKRVEDLGNEIVDLLPHPKWSGEHLIITGGEPLLGWQKAYPSLLDHPQMEGLEEVTFETNGTQPLKDELADYITNSWNPTHWAEDSITFSVSPKLESSGEDTEDSIKPDIVASYEEYGYVYLKFVVGDEADVEEVLDYTCQYRNAGFEGPVYIMPVGGTFDKQYEETRKRVAELSMKYRLRFSDRLQVGLFKNEWGT